MRRRLSEGLMIGDRTADTLMLIDGVIICLCECVFLNIDHVNPNWADAAASGNDASLSLHQPNPQRVQ